MAGAPEHFVALEPARGTAEVGADQQDRREAVLVSIEHGALVGEDRGRPNGVVVWPAGLEQKGLIVSNVRKKEAQAQNSGCQGGGGQADQPDKC